MTRLLPVSAPGLVANHPPAPAGQSTTLLGLVLAEVAPGVDERDVRMTPLATGGQATVSLLTWSASAGGVQQIVLKQYRTSGPGSVESVLEEEFAALRQLYGRLNGQVIDGWQVYSPRPLFKTLAPPVIAMTVVPGQSLSAILRRRPDAHTSAWLAELPAIVVAALKRFWDESPRVYGDCNLNNVLCDPASRSVSLVDPGALGAIYRCDDAPSAWYPASRDLAYLLFETAAPGWRAMLRGAARRRQMRMAQAIVAAFVRQIPEAADRRRLLAEIRACADVHMTRIRRSLSIAGVWRGFVRWSAGRSVRRALAEIASDRVPGRVVE